MSEIIVDVEKLRVAINQMVHEDMLRAHEREIRGPKEIYAEIDSIIASRTVDIPEIVCLCGSTRFMEAFNYFNSMFSRQGKIVLSVELTRYDSASDPQKHDPDVKRRLDELHKRKIDLCDTVFVLDVDGYIGESTKSEIEYAEKIGKPVKYLTAEASDFRVACVNACGGGE